ncbi:N-acetyltransferase family protein [Micromonospora sp. NPDC003197]
MRRVEQGEQLPDRPWLRTSPQPAGRAAAVVAFPGLSVVAADVDPDWVHDQLADGDLSAPLNPPFLTAICDKTGLTVNNIDAVLLADPLDGPPELPLTPIRAADHPRVRRAHRYRDDVRVWITVGGVLILGRGLTGRWEVAVEVDETARGTGLGRRLAGAARYLSPQGRPVWAQIAPGNAASLRAFLAAGYRPVGAEALLTHAGS